MKQLCSTTDYDALGRKVRWTESAWVALGNPNGSVPGASLRIPPGHTEEKGWGNNADRENPVSVTKRRRIPAVRRR